MLCSVPGLHVLVVGVTVGARPQLLDHDDLPRHVLQKSATHNVNTSCVECVRCRQAFNLRCPMHNYVDDPPHNYLLLHIVVRILAHLVTSSRRWSRFSGVRSGTSITMRCVSLIRLILTFANDVLSFAASELPAATSNVNLPPTQRRMSSFLQLHLQCGLMHLRAIAMYVPTAHHEKQIVAETLSRT